MLKAILGCVAGGINSDNDKLDLATSATRS